MLIVGLSRRSWQGPRRDPPLTPGGRILGGYHQPRPGRTESPKHCRPMLLPAPSLMPPRPITRCAGAQARGAEAEAQVVALLQREHHATTPDHEDAACTPHRCHRGRGVPPHIGIHRLHLRPHRVPGPGQGLSGLSSGLFRHFSVTFAPLLIPSPVALFLCGSVRRLSSSRVPLLRIAGPSPSVLVMSARPLALRVPAQPFWVQEIRRSGAHVRVPVPPIPHRVLTHERPHHRIVVPLRQQLQTRRCVGVVPQLADVLVRRSLGI